MIHIDAHGIIFGVGESVLRPPSTEIINWIIFRSWEKGVRSPSPESVNRMPFGVEKGLTVCLTGDDYKYHFSVLKLTAFPAGDNKFF